MRVQTAWCRSDERLSAITQILDVRYGGEGPTVTARVACGHRVSVVMSLENLMLARDQRSA